MANILILLQLVGLLLDWTVITSLLVPCALVVWALKSIMRAIEWLRDKAMEA